MAKSNLPERIILGIFILVLIVLIADFVRLHHSGSGRGQLTIVVPWGLIAIFISLYIFREYNRVRRAKRDNRREYIIIYYLLNAENHKPTFRVGFSI